MTNENLASITDLTCFNTVWDVQKIPQLRKLTVLRHVGGAQSDIPDEIYRLGLKTLILKYGPKYNPLVRNLVQLTELRLSCELTCIPCEIFSLTNLINLDLSINAITDVPNEINCLTNLKTLSLGHNQLKTLSLTLAKLESLLADSNYLESIEINQLSNLSHLCVSSNLLTNVPELTRLPKLQHLILTNNLITDIPAFPNLKSLDISCNQIVTMHYDYNFEK